MESISVLEMVQRAKNAARELATVDEKIREKALQLMTVKTGRS